MNLDTILDDLVVLAFVANTISWSSRRSTRYLVIPDKGWMRVLCIALACLVGLAAMVHLARLYTGVFAGLPSPAFVIFLLGYSIHYRHGPRGADGRASYGKV